jgi:hypothetical protein
MIGRLLATIAVVAMIPPVGVVSVAAPLNDAPVRTAAAACAVAEAAVSAKGHFPISEIAFCDPSLADDPTEYYVLALHGKRYDCGGVCGSTNMGWYAIRKSDARVFEWNVADWTLGPPI